MRTAKILFVFFVCISVWAFGCRKDEAPLAASDNDESQDREVYRKPKEQRTTKGKTLPRIVLIYNTSEDHKAIAEMAKEMWKRELGADVEIKNEEWRAYLKDTNERNYSIGRGGWIADYNDPNTFLDMWMTDNDNNQTGWGERKYDEMIKSAARELDPKIRMHIFNHAEDYLINNQMPIMPIYFYVNRNVVATKVRGMEYNMRDIFPLKYAWIQEQGRPAPADRQVFKMNNGDEPETLDPALMTGNIEFTVAIQLFEGLVQYNPKTLRPEPCIAKSWDISRDGLVYTFHLRNDAKWTNGDPVTANDFYYSWKRVLDPSTDSKYVNQAEYIKNAKKYYDEQVEYSRNRNEYDLQRPDFSEVGIKVLDDYTFQVTLENPTAFWLDLVAFQTLLPVNEKCVYQYGTKWTDANNIVTNGPFKMIEWKPKDRIVLVKNPDYWNAGAVKLEKIIIYQYKDPIQGLNMLEKGETDWVRSIPSAVMDKWKDRPETHITPMLSTYYYRFNVNKAPFDDPLVRMAFNLAIDKQKISDYLGAGQLPATTFVPPGILGYESPDGPAFNPKKARELLREAGYSVPDVDN
jgi:ABC-type oligopeptide transport system substrate-binding subunit